MMYLRYITLTFIAVGGEEEATGAHTAPTMGYAMQHLFMSPDCNGIIIILLRRTTTKPEWDKEKKKKPIHTRYA